MAKANKETNAEENVQGETSAADLSTESLKNEQGYDTAGVAVRSSLTVVKQIGRDEFGNPVIEKGKQIEIEKDGETIKVSQKAFDVIYALHGYTVVEAKSKKADKE